MTETADIPRLDFGAPSPLDHEHRRLMDEHHRKVDFTGSTAAQLAPPLREALADLWRERARSEHRSVGIFATYTLDLLAAGAPASFLSLACRAQLDEVRHAETFSRLAGCYSGRDESPEPGISPLPDDRSLSVSELAAVEALHLCVGAESFSTALLDALLREATDPAVRGALSVVLSDELHHARMGWAYLGAVLPVDRVVRDAVQRSLVPIFDGLVEGLFGPADANAGPDGFSEADGFSDADRLIARAHGYLPLSEQRALFVSLIEQVWCPSLPRIGLDPSALRGRYGP